MSSSVSPPFPAEGITKPPVPVGQQPNANIVRIVAGKRTSRRRQSQLSSSSTSSTSSNRSKEPSGSASRPLSNSTDQGSTDLGYVTNPSSLHTSKTHGDRTVSSSGYGSETRHKDHKPHDTLMKIVTGHDSRERADGDTLFQVSFVSQQESTPSLNSHQRYHVPVPSETIISDTPVSDLQESLEGNLLVENQQSEPNAAVKTKKRRHSKKDDTRALKGGISNLSGTGAAAISRFFSSTVNEPLEVGLDFRLDIVQQPTRARMIGFSEKDRRPVDPPPVIRLVVRDPRGHDLLLTDESVFYVMHVSICHENEDKLIDLVVNPFRDNRGNPVLAQTLVGTVVSPCHVLVNPSGARGMYFAFPDLSCRVHGRYRLKFKLFYLSQDILRLSSPGIQKAELISNVFSVYPPKEFPGMSASTELSKCFARQGVQIHVRPEAARRS